MNQATGTGAALHRDILLQSNAMTPQDINNNFQKTITIWKNLVDNYTDTEFATKPDENDWSIGQVCRHLINNCNNFAFSNIEKCISGSENVQEQKTEMGEKALAANELPDIQIKVPPSLQRTPIQPESKQVVKNDFKLLEDRFRNVANEVSKSANNGKTKHPLLGFLNGREWLQLVDIHFRHHLRQKERIDIFLKK
ncbi:MAG: DinB family protein [Chitinophagales bacterium]